MEIVLGLLWFLMILGPPLGALIGLGWLVRLLAVPRARMMPGVLWLTSYALLWVWGVAVARGLSAVGVMSFPADEGLCLVRDGEPDMSPLLLTKPFSYECAYGGLTYDRVPEWVNPVFWAAIPLAVVFVVLAQRSGSAARVSRLT